MTCPQKFEQITRMLIGRGLTISTMESCTCGTVASLLTDTEGASAILKGAYITYSNAAKVMCGVPAEVIETHGVYSPQTAAAMAEACAKAYAADIGIGVTGSFGNVDPNNADSIPGQVHFALSYQGKTRTFFIPDVPPVSRREAKLYAADKIADALLALLQ